jgi:hypothetical protein
MKTTFERGTVGVDFPTNHGEVVGRIIMQLRFFQTRWRRLVVQLLVVMVSAGLFITLQAYGSQKKSESNLRQRLTGHASQGKNSTFLMEIKPLPPHTCRTAFYSGLGSGPGLGRKPAAPYSYDYVGECCQPEDPRNSMPFSNFWLLDPLKVGRTKQ